MKEEYIKTIEIKNSPIDFYKQHMWLIGSYGSREIERVELFGKSIEEGIEELKNLIEKILI